MAESDPDTVYELFQAGARLLAQGDAHAAAISLARARDLDPSKDSIREALGRAYFQSQRYDAAAVEFRAIIARHQTDHFALFCLGRCLQQLGRHDEARHPLALASHLRPDRRDYALYRDRARRRAV